MATAAHLENAEESPRQLRIVDQPSVHWRSHGSAQQVSAMQLQLIRFPLVATYWAAVISLTHVRLLMPVNRQCSVRSPRRDGPSGRLTASRG